jgi:hypothetical protein
MTRARGGLRAAMLAFLGAACVACAHPWVVERAYGGDVVEGRYVAPEGYAAFLRGAIAQAEGRQVEALRGYRDAAERDPGSPEPWTRMAEVRCSMAGRHVDHLARAPEGRPGEVANGERALDRALALAPGYAPAWAVRAACAEARGDGRTAREAAARAAELDPRGDGANILLARSAEGVAASADARAVLVALTVTAADPVAAWNALALWAEAHGDVALWARALVELARRAPERRAAIARSAEELAGAGSLGEARAVAAAAVEASESPLPADLPLAARLALDEAVARRDGAALRRRATRARLPLDEAGGRALLGGERALAHDVTAAAAAADPGALGARLVLAVADGGDLLGAAASMQPGDTPASAAALIAFGVALLHVAPPAEARAALAAAPRLPVVAGDDRVVRAAVDLASRGVLPGDALPPDGALELSVIAGVPPAARRGAADPVAAADALDLRHRYLSLALTQPDSADLRAMAERLRSVSATDPVVAAAAAIVQLTAGLRVAPDAPRALLARNPADPLLAATALRLAEKAGDADVARRAREALGVFGTTRRTVE